MHLKNILRITTSDNINWNQKKYIIFHGESKDL